MAGRWILAALALAGLATVGLTLPGPHAPQAGAARADLWSGFYTSSAPAPKEIRNSAPYLSPNTAAAMSGPSDPVGDSVCLRAILTAQARHGIPGNLLLAIGIQEAGRGGPNGLTVWPWTVNANGEGAFFRDKAAALDWVRGKMMAGVQSIDVGCMQVNQKWHGTAFSSLDQAFDPYVNADYAARYLVSLYRETGDWWSAAARYHSGTKQYQDIYLTSLTRNMQVAAANAPRFHALAALPAPAGGATPRPLPMPAAAGSDLAGSGDDLLLTAVTPQPPVFWGSAGGGDDGSAGGSYSIYSNHPIQPVLPGYRDTF